MNAETGWHETPVYEPSTLAPGHKISGPAVVDEATTTILIGPGDQLEVARFDRQPHRVVRQGPCMSETDPISLALVQNRLDHVARQMGWVMVRTSRSPIFNQSHDFSCFITDAQGTLVSQADGIPIHTGGGGFAIRALLGVFGARSIPAMFSCSTTPTWQAAITCPTG